MSLYSAINEYNINHLLTYHAEIPGPLSAVLTSYAFSLYVKMYLIIFAHGKTCDSFSICIYAYVCSPRNSTEAGAKSNGKSKWRIMQGIVLVPKL